MSAHVATIIMYHFNRGWVNISLLFIVWFVSFDCEFVLRFGQFCILSAVVMLLVQSFTVL